MTGRTTRRRLAVEAAAGHAVERREEEEEEERAEASRSGWARAGGSERFVRSPAVQVHLRFTSREARVRVVVVAGGNRGVASSPGPPQFPQRRSWLLVSSARSLCAPSAASHTLHTANEHIIQCRPLLSQRASSLSLLAARHSPHIGLLVLAARAHAHARYEAGRAEREVIDHGGLSSC